MIFNGLWIPIARIVEQISEPFKYTRSRMIVMKAQLWVKEWDVLGIPDKVLCSVDPRDVAGSGDRDDQQLTHHSAELKLKEAVPETFLHGQTHQTRSCVDCRFECCDRDAVHPERGNDDFDRTTHPCPLFWSRGSQDPFSTYTIQPFVWRFESSRHASFVHVSSDDSVAKLIHDGTTRLAARRDEL